MVLLVRVSLIILRLTVTITREKGASAQPHSAVLLDPGVLVPWMLCNAVLFIPTQWENLLWGMGLANALPVLFLFASIAVASSSMSMWTKVMFVALLNTLATYSQAIGFLSWPLTAVLLAWSDSRSAFKAKLPMLAFFAFATIVNVSLYFVGYVKPNDGGQNPYAITLGGAVLYFCVYLGNAFAVTTSFHAYTMSGMLSGIMLILLLSAQAYSVSALRRHGDASFFKRVLVWSAVAWFPILSDAMATLSRSGYGTLQALSSRYVTFTVCLPIALVHIVAMVCRDIARRHGLTHAEGQLNPMGRVAYQLPAVLSLGLACLVLLSYPVGLNRMRKEMTYRLCGKAAVLLCEVALNVPILEQTVIKPAKDLLHYAPRLSELGYLRPKLFKSRIATELPPGNPTLFTGSGDSLWRSGNDSVTFSGWVALSKSLQRTGVVCLSYDDMQGRPLLFAIAESGITRKDSSGKEMDAGDSHLGWFAAATLSSFPGTPQKLLIRAWVLDVQNGSIAPLEGPFTLER